MQEKTTPEVSDNTQTTNKTGFLKNSNFKGWQLGVFAAVFALVGFLIIRSFAAGNVIAELQAEGMTLSTGSAVVADTSASGGSAVQMKTNGALSGTVNLPSQSSSVTLVAKGTQCKGSPIVSLAVDGASVLANTSVSSTSWTSYSANLSVGAGSHTVTVNGSNLGTYAKGKKNSCGRTLYIDTMNFYGQSTPPALPTVSLSASPLTVNAGQASTLSWSSSNASACSAVGGWTSNTATSGSQSLTPANTTSYTMTCTGSGGSSSASATVTVNAVTPTPTPPDVYVDPGTQTYALGSTFTVTVRENSGTTGVNAVQANLSYPADKLTLVSVDGSTSAFTTQAQNSGSNGTIQIARGIIGSLTGDQVVAVLTFKVNSVAGTASVPFTTGTALLSSSTNQDILPSLSSAYGGTYTLK